MAMMHFFTYTGLFDTFRMGVLKNYYETQFNSKSADIQEYIRLYEKYQVCKIKNKV